MSNQVPQTTTPETDSSSALPLLRSVDSRDVEKHLETHHGVRYNWDNLDPCFDSPIGVHNQRHWPNYHPSHSHQLSTL